MTQKYISNQEQRILSDLENKIIHGQLCQIWITMYKSDDNNIIKINDKNNVEVNIYNDNGKLILTKIICFISMRKNKEFPPFFIVLKKDNINLRKKILEFNKKKINIDTFNYLMQSFLIVTPHMLPMGTF